MGSLRLKYFVLLWLFFIFIADFYFFYFILFLLLAVNRLFVAWGGFSTLDPKIQLEPLFPEITRNRTIRLWIDHISSYVSISPH